MHCSVTAGELAAALKVIHPAVAGRTVLPILTHVLLNARDDRLTLSATNLEISLRTSIAAEVSEAGRTTVSEAKLSMWAGLQGRESTVTLRGDDKNLTLLAGRDRAKIGAISAEDFPPLPEMDAEPINVSATLLSRGLDLTLWSVAKEDSRPVFSGLLMTFDGETLELAGANGHTLGFARVDLAAPVAERTVMIVPGRSLAAISGLLKTVGLVEISVSTHGVSFDVAGTVLYSRLIDGIFPDYRVKILTEAQSVSVVSTAALELQIRSAQMAGRATPVRFKADPADGTLTIWSREVDGEHEGVLSGAISGEPVELALQAEYALEAIRALGGESIEVWLNGPQKPAMFVTPGAADTALQVLMPMYVKADNSPIRTEAA